MSSGSNPFLNRPNAGTVICSLEQISLVPGWTVKDQFEKHYDDIRAMVTTPGAPGYSVLAIYTHGIVSAGRLAAVRPGEPGGVLIIGRHTSAEMCLSRDPTIALRHLAIRVVADASGEPEARLIDLNTGQGFQIEGAGQFQGARISGPAFVRIGSYVLMLFPRSGVPEIWPARPDGVFDRLVSAHVVEPDEEKAGVVMGYRGGGIGDGFRRETIITRVGPPVAPRRQRRMGALPVDTVAVLTARQEHGQTLYPLTAQHLERGVLLGRYDRCEVELEGLSVTEAASRVHLLLLQDGGRFLVIDTASSNGTWVDGEPVRVAPLPDEAILELAPGNVVHWRVVRGGTASPSSPRGELPDPKPSSPAPAPNLGSLGGNVHLPRVVASQRDHDTSPPEDDPDRLSRPFDWDAVVAGASAWNPGNSMPERSADHLPSVLDLVKPSPASSPWPAIITAALGVIMMLVVIALAQSEPEPRQCVHPINDFGTDSPALRLYLQHQDPNVCFEYRWSPRVQDHVDNLREIQRTPPPE